MGKKMMILKKRMRNRKRQLRVKVRLERKSNQLEKLKRAKKEKMRKTRRVKRAKVKDLQFSPSSSNRTRSRSRLVGKISLTQIVI